MKEMSSKQSHEHANQPTLANLLIWSKKIEWSGVRLVRLSGSYYPPNGDYGGAPNQS
jgi:hypothetical protein